MVVVLHCPQSHYPHAQAVAALPPIEESGAAEAAGEGADEGAAEEAIGGGKSPRRTRVRRG